jgi:HEAT repeat protein
MASRHLTDADGVIVISNEASSENSSFAAFLLPAPCARDQQVITGRFYPEKTEYLIGEPIIIDFEVVNATNEPAEMADADCPPSWMTPQFEVTGAAAKKEIGFFTCGRRGILGDCLIGTSQIPANGKYAKRWLLDGPFELNSPGTYRVRAKAEREIRGEGSSEILADLRVESEFNVTLHAPQDGELEAAYRPFLNDLTSKDVMVRSFAASAITQHAPLFAEAAILALADDDSPVAFASIEGLARLATPSARAKLFQMSSTGSPEYLRQPAIQAIGEIKNWDDCQGMLVVGSQSEDYTQGEAYIVSAQICKEQAIPALLRLVPKADSQLLMYLATAFENTRSRNAVPPLIGLLTNPDEYVRSSVEESLATLTHRKSVYGIASADAASKSRVEWSNWWAVNGNKAPIYGPDECTDPQPLP